MNAVTIQAVAAAIRATDGVTQSHRYTHKGSSAVRSVGLYAQKRYNGAIELGYWTSGYQIYRDRAQIEIAKAIATLETKGYKVVERVDGNIVKNTWFEVVAA